MKVARSQPAPASQPLSLARLFSAIVKIGLAALVVAVLGVAVLMALRPDFVKRAVTSIEQRWGYGYGARDAALADKWSIAFGNYLRNAGAGLPEIPDLVIDVPFGEMSRIYSKREEALAAGKLVQSDGDMVKAEIRAEGREIPIKLRLKGDWNDHLMGRKWSFRIHVRGSDQLFGMRRFSIQNPKTRGWQAEPMYFAVMRQFGVVVPRYMFVNVSLNGDSMGIMALEEFFAKELLENNQRKEGVILRFDESLAWDAKDAISNEDNGWGGAFDNFTNAPVDGIGSGAIAESPVLTQQYATAAGLLHAFVDGDLPPSEVFDVQQFAAAIAVSDFFGSLHAMRWHNLRFYLNPITLRLEPIPFDATLQDALMDDTSIIHGEPLLLKVLGDPVMLDAYTQVLQELTGMMADGSMIELLQQTEARYLPLLQTEFRMLQNYPTSYLQPRIDSLLAQAIAGQGKGAANPNFYLEAEAEESEYPVLAHLGVRAAGENDLLQVDNAIPREVLLTSVAWVRPSDDKRVSAVSAARLPLLLPPRGIGSTGERMALELVAPPGPDWILEASLRLRGRNWSTIVRPQRIHGALTASPLPQGDIDAQLAAHSFLRLDENSRQLKIDAGTWDLQQPLIIPAGYSLRVDAGTKLRFGPEAPLVAYGPINFAGTKSSPVSLEPLNNESWPGFVVMQAKGKSILKNVNIRDTHSLAIGAWVLTGGANFYVSDVDLVDCEIRGSHGEDALNIVRSNFDIRGLVIRDTASDAFDADFSTGTLAGSRFVNIGTAGGGDGVDISGSQVTVEDTDFTDVSDKALSVGERSDMTARRIGIANVGTGAASKDGSVLQLTDARILNASFAALTAYIKKPEYGPASITAEQVVVQATEVPELVQTGSRISLDGRVIETRDVDVDELYETVMRKGLR